MSENSIQIRFVFKRKLCVKNSNKFLLQPTDDVLTTTFNHLSKQISFRKSGDGFYVSSWPQKKRH